VGEELSQIADNMFPTRRGALFGSWSPVPAVGLRLGISPSLPCGLGSFAIFLATQHSSLLEDWVRLRFFSPLNNISPLATTRRLGSVVNFSPLATNYSPLLARLGSVVTFSPLTTRPSPLLEIGFGCSFRFSLIPQPFFSSLATARKLGSVVRFDFPSSLIPQPSTLLEETPDALRLLIQMGTE
jgi:hypothetical protein